MAKATYLLAAMLLPYSLNALRARMVHDTGNASASRAAASDAAEVEQRHERIAYSIFARRDMLTGDRQLLNAQALVYAALPVEAHSFRFGLGSHYRQEKLERRVADAGSFYPAVGISWLHPVFHAEVSGSEYLTRSAVSFLLRLAVPVEFNTDFEYLFSQPYRWSANAFAFVSRHVGLIFGYEPLAVRARAGFWLAPVDSLQLRALARLGMHGDTYWEFSLGYTLASSPGAVTTETPAIRTAETKVWQKKRRLPKEVPAFGILVKWGLAPAEALKFSRDKDACALNASSRTILQRKNWGCRDEA